MMVFLQAMTSPLEQLWSTMWSLRACRCSLDDDPRSAELGILLFWGFFTASFLGFRVALACRTLTFVAMQTLAGAFGDKASLLVDLNERALAMRTGKRLVM